MLLTLLLASMQPPQGHAGLLQLDCAVAARGRSANSQSWPASIRLGIAGRRIDSVLLDGPAPFSSYVPVLGSRQLLHKRDQYRGSFQKKAIRLRRTGIDRVDLVLEPKDGVAGAYTGFWTHTFLVERRPIVVEGTIACRSMTGRGTI